MLFDEPKEEPKIAARPTLPPGTDRNYEIGFLFNFISGKSTRFDLEPILILKQNGYTEYKRVSMQAEKGLAYLEPLSEELYNNFTEFSDDKLLGWMTRTGNRYMRNHSGTWAHVSARELVNLRKHYRDLMEKLWPTLSAWPHVFVLRTGRFNNTVQTPQPLGKEVGMRFTADKNGDTITLKLILTLDGDVSDITVNGGFLLYKKGGTLFLPPISKRWQSSIFLRMVL